MHERAQAPSDKSAEHATSVGPAPARPEAAASAPHLIGLQRAAGNQAVLALLGRRPDRPPVQRQADPWTQTDGAGGGVDVAMRVQQLRLAIRYQAIPPHFQIDRAAVSTALEDLTRDEARAVKREFKAKAEWDLADVIQAQFEIGDGYKVPNNLSAADRRQLVILTGGTAAPAPAAPVAESAGEMLGATLETLGALTGHAAEAKQVTDVVRKTVGAKARDSLRAADERAQSDAMLRRANADAAAFRAALDRKDVETALAFLKRPKAGRDALAAAYQRVFGEPILAALTIRLAGTPALRAMALMGGDLVLAERLALEQDLAAKDKAAKEAKDARQRGDMAIVEDYFAAREKQAKRKVEARVEEIAGGIDTTTPAGRDMGRKHLAEVLGRDMGPGDVRKRIGADTDAVMKAIVSGDLAAELGARLARKDTEGTLKPADIEAALRQLSTLAAPGSDRKAGSVDPAFLALENSFNANNKRRTLAQVLAGQPTTFADLMSVVGVDQADLARNRALFEGAGKLPEWQELYFALTRDPKDMPKAREILGSKTRKGVELLSVVYTGSTGGRSLQADLLGAGADALEAINWLGGDAREAVAERRELLQGGAFESEATDPVAQLAEEGAWLFARIAALEKRVMDNRGAFAEVRDWMGNVEHELVDLARGDAGRAKKELDRALAASPPEVSVAQQQVRQLRRIHFRLKHAIDAYKESTKKAFAEFVDLAVLVVSTAATMGQGGFIVMALRSTAAKIGTNLALRAEDYTADEFLSHLRGGIAEMAGGAVVSKLYKPLAASWADRALKSGLDKTLAGRVAAKVGPIANWEAEEQIESIVGGLVEGKGIEVMGAQEHLSAAGQLGLGTVMGAGVDAFKARSGRGGGDTRGSKGAEAGPGPATTAPAPDRPPAATTTTAEPGATQPRTTTPTPAPEPTPPVAGGGGPGTPVDRGTVEPLPAEGSGEVVPESATAAETPKQKDARERHEAHLAIEAASRKLRELDEAGEPSGSMIRLVAEAQLQEARDAFVLAHGRRPDEPPPIPDKWDTEMVVQDAIKTSRAEADKILDRMFRDDPWREVGIYRNTATGEYIVIQGRKSNVSVELDPLTNKPIAPRGEGEAQRWKELLDDGSDVGHWELMVHTHPNFQKTGATRPANHYPSWKPNDGGDFGALVRESKRAGGAPRESKIVFNTPDGPQTTTFSYDPARDEPFHVVPPSGEPLRFVDGRAYWDFMEGKFPELVSAPAAPVQPTAKEPDEYEPVVAEANPTPDGPAPVATGAATLDEPAAESGDAARAVGGAPATRAAGRRIPEVDSDLAREPGRPASTPTGGTYEPRNKARYEEVGRTKAGTSGGIIVVDRWRRPPRRYLFKPVRNEVDVPRASARGIEAGTYSTRAVAAEMASSALGIRTPHVELVKIGKRKGTLTEWWGGQSLADLAVADPAAFALLKQTEPYRQAMARIETLDYLINNVDRVQNLGNYLLQVNADGSFKDLVPIDSELSFTSTAERARVGRFANDLPASYDADMAAKLMELSKDRTAFAEKIRPLVGDEAIPGVLDRLDKLVADMLSKQALGKPKAAAP